MDKTGRDLADSALAAFAEEQRVAQVGIALDQLGRVVNRIQIRHRRRLVAIGHEHAREAGQREAARDVAAGGVLRELVDVAQRPLVDVDAAGDVAVEQERLGERDLVILGARASLQRQRQRLAAAEEIRRLERELVAVLLFELEGDVDLVFLTRGLLDVDPLAFFERLEVTELIEALDAVLQRFGIERRTFEQPHFTANHVVARGGVARKRQAVYEILLAFRHAHRDVDGGIGGSGDRPFSRRDRFEVGETRELEVTQTAVHLTRLDQAVANRLVGVPVAGLQLERWQDELGVDDLVAFEREVADFVARPLINRNVELDPAGFLVLAILDGLDFGLADARGDVTLIAVVLDDLFGVLVELALVIGALARDPRQHVVLFRGLHLARQGAVPNGDVAVEVQGTNLDLWTLLDVEHHLHELWAGRQRLHGRGHFRELVALVRHEGLDDALDALDDGLIEE